MASDLTISFPQLPFSPPHTDEQNHKRYRQEESAAENDENQPCGLTHRSFTSKIGSLQRSVPMEFMQNMLRGGVSKLLMCRIWQNSSVQLATRTMF